MANRDEFLKTVSRATMSGLLPTAHRYSEPLPEMPEADLVATMRANAQAANAVVHGPMSRHGVPRAVTGIATGHGARSFIAWDDPGVPGVNAGLSAQGMERLQHEVPKDDRLDHNLEYSAVVVGVTGADAGLAESGSVVLAHGPGRPRMASLIPDVHIALLHVGDIHRNLAHWAAESTGLVAETTNLVLVTGPSRTGDIEQQLNLGVHGPRHVHVVMYR